MCDCLSWQMIASVCPKSVLANDRLPSQDRLRTNRKKRFHTGGVCSGERRRRCDTRADLHRHGRRGRERCWCPTAATASAAAQAAAPAASERRLCCRWWGPDQLLPLRYVFLLMLLWRVSAFAGAPGACSSRSCSCRGWGWGRPVGSVEPHADDADIIARASIRRPA